MQKNYAIPLKMKWFYPFSHREQGEAWNTIFRTDLDNCPAIFTLETLSVAFLHLRENTQ